MNGAKLALLTAIAVIAGVACDQDTAFTVKELRNSADAIVPDTQTGERNEISDSATQVDTFRTATTTESTVTWELDGNELRESFALVKGDGHSVDHQQIERTLYAANFEQGYEGDVTQESFSLVEAGKLDLLLVIDNSGTMQTYQDLIAPRLEPLLQSIGNTDWQIAIVTTDSHCIRGLVTADAYNADADGALNVFSNAVSAGTFGANVERGIEMAIKGFYPDATCETRGNDWARNAAEKAVLIVSDEENCGSASNEGCNDDTGYAYFGAEEFAAQAPANTTVYGIFDNEDECGWNGFENQPDEYYDLVAATGGIWRPICSDDYNAVLGDISDDVASTIRRKFDLSYPPDQIDFTVMVDGQALASGYEVDGSTVVLDGSIDGETVSLQYSYGSKPITDSVQLEGSPDLNSFQVMIDGEALDLDTVEIDLDAGELRFLNPPGDRAQVAITYREQGELPNVFDFDAAYLEPSLRVSINGEATADYDVGSGVVQFWQPPPDGAAIEVRYWLEEELQTRYKADLVEEELLESVRVIDVASGDEIAAEIRDGFIHFDIRDVARYDDVTVVYYLEQDPASLEAELSDMPIDGSLSVSVDEKAEACAAEIAVRGNAVDLSCLANRGGKVSVTYSHPGDLKNRFTVAAKGQGKGNQDSNNWRVYIDDREVFDYEIEKGEVVIPLDLLTEDSIVRIEVD